MRENGRKPPVHAMLIEELSQTCNCIILDASSCTLMGKVLIRSDRAWCGASC